MDMQRERMEFWSDAFQSQTKLGKDSEAASRWADDCLKEFTQRFGEGEAADLASLVLKTLDTQQKYFKCARAVGGAEVARTVLIESKELEACLRQKAHAVLSRLDNTSGESHTESLFNPNQGN